MKKNHFSIISLICLLALTLTAGGNNPERQKANRLEHPNIIIVFADDLGYGDLDCYGATQYTTPNIDKLAANGVRFTNFYVAQAVCSASRAALLTGCYSNRVGIAGALFPGAQIGLNPSEETIAEVLDKSGYHCAIFGKWHLGDAKEFLPLQQGFEEYFGLPYSNDMWRYNLDGSLVTPEQNQVRSKYPPLMLIDGNEPVKEIVSMEDQSQLTTMYTERAVAFIEKHKKEPFFLYLAHSMPHVPIGASSKFRGRSEQGLYGDVVMEIDWSVGQIIDALERNHLTDNTLVIFTSDNGPWLNYGNHAGSAGGLREGKGTAWEGGQREPCIMKWPGQIPEGIVCNKLAATIDILPTLANISGSPLPSAKIDGVNILPLMIGDQKANPRDVLLYYYYGDCLMAIRKGEWKLVFPYHSQTYEGFAPGRDGEAGKTGTVEVKEALYDLRRDPGERYNVIEYYPEIADELRRIADDARTDIGDGIRKIKGQNVREPGRIKK
jgi:arylsulfatase A-like enzyme